MLGLDRVLHLKENFILYKLEIEDGMFWLFNIKNGDSFKLNEVSYNILSLFDGNKSTGEIGKSILDNYPDTNPDVILKDFEDLMEIMEKENIFAKKGDANNEKEKC